MSSFFGFGAHSNNSGNSNPFGITSQHFLIDTSTHHDVAIEFSNYDVLLARASDGSIMLDSKRPHVGNNRFQVLLNMNRKEYDDKTASGEDATNVIKRVIDIVCNKCEPNGRFMIKQEKNKWMILNTTEVEEFVKEYLSDPSSKKAPSALTGSFLNIRFRGHNKDQHSTIDSSQQDDPPQHLRATISDPNSDSEKKRRRRSSLLRRSVTEEGGPGDGTGVGDKKKAGRFSVRFPQWLQPKRAGGGGPDDDRGGGASTKPGPDQLDVIFNSSMSKLIEGHTGNNRIAVLVNMKRETYQNGDDATKESILKELYDAVIVSYKGRFMMLKDFAGGSHNAYILLDKDDDRLTINMGLHALLTNPEPVPLGMNGITFKTTTTAAAAMPNSPPQNNLINAVLQQPEGSDSSVKKQTLQALHKVKDDAGAAIDANSMRSAAIASLQKRKQRQGITSKIRNLASGNLIKGVPSKHKHASSDSDFRFSTAPPVQGLGGRHSSLPEIPFHGTPSQQELPGMLPLQQRGFLHRNLSAPTDMLHMQPHLQSQGSANLSMMMQQQRQQQQQFVGNNNNSVQMTPLYAGGGVVENAGGDYGAGNGATDRNIAGGSANNMMPWQGVGAATSRPSNVSQMSEGMIEDLLSGLDVSGDFRRPSVLSPQQPAQTLPQLAEHTDES